MVFNYTGHRKEEYFYQLLDKSENILGTLKTTKEGSLTFNVDEPIQSGGTVTVYPTEEINWGAHLVRPFLKVTDSRGNSESWPLGTYTVSAPVDSYKGVNHYVELQLHDKLIILDDDGVGDYYSIPKDALITDAIKSLIESTGQTSIALTPSTAKSLDMQVWEPNTPKLEIINELLKQINYYSLWTDGYGEYQVQPFQLAKDRPITRVFERGFKAIHKSEYTVDRDNSRIPNRVRLIGSGSSQGDLLVGVAENKRLDSDYSYPNVGRWIDFRDSGVEAESPAMIKDLAERKLEELTSPTSTFEIEHLTVPVGLRDRVRFITTHNDVNAIVAQMTMELNPGSLCSSTLREVQDLQGT